MKATLEIPDELYRRVKAKSALEGRAIREVATELFRGYVDPPQAVNDQASRPQTEGVELIDGEPIPLWFGVFRDYSQRVEKHDMESIRKSIAEGLARERGF